MVFYFNVMKLPKQFCGSSLIMRSPKAALVLIMPLTGSYY